MLNKPNLKNQIYDLLTRDYNDENSDTAMLSKIDSLSDSLATKIDNYIKSARFTIPPGTVSIGSGTAVTPNVAPIIINNGLS